MKKLWNKFVQLSVIKKIVLVAVPVVVILGAVLIPISYFNLKKTTSNVKEVQATQNTQTAAKITNNKDILANTTKPEPSASPKASSTPMPSATPNLTTKPDSNTPEKETPDKSNTMPTPIQEAPEIVSESNVVPKDEVSINSSDSTWTNADADDILHRWTEKGTWTASNGIVLKINDGYVDVVRETGEGYWEALWQEDPDADWSPNSEYSKAVNEFIYNDPAYKNGMQRYDSGVVDISKLPAVPTTSSKQSSFVTNAEFNAYKQGWDVYHTFQGTGDWQYSALYQLQINSDFAGSVAAGQGYMWDIRAQGDDSWKVTIYRNLSELNWHGMLTCLKLITPDANALYNEFYTQFYTGSDTFPAPGAWVTIGNSQAMADDGDGQCYFYFK